MDIHRPENFNYKERLLNVIDFANKCIEKYAVPVKLLYFKRLKDKLLEYNIDLGKVEMIELMPFKEYLDSVYNSLFLISDSGTGQEEPALLNTPVIVPRDYTERPQSYSSNCSIKLNINDDDRNYDDVFKWIDSSINGEFNMQTEWLGNGNTSKIIVEKLQEYFYLTSL